MRCLCDCANHSRRTRPAASVKWEVGTAAEMDQPRNTPNTRKPEIMGGTSSTSPQLPFGHRLLRLPDAIGLPTLISSCPFGTKRSQYAGHGQAEKSRPERDGGIKV